MIKLLWFVLHGFGVAVRRAFGVDARRLRKLEQRIDPKYWGKDLRSR